MRCRPVALSLPLAALTLLLSGCLAYEERQPVAHPPRAPLAHETRQVVPASEPHVAPYGVPSALLTVAPPPPGASEHAVYAAVSLREAVAALEAGELEAVLEHARSVLALDPLQDPVLETYRAQARFLRAEVGLRKWMMAAVLDPTSVASWETSMMELHMGWRLVEALYGALQREYGLTRWHVAAHVRTAHVYDHVRRTLEQTGCPHWLVADDCPAFAQNLHATAAAARVQATRSLENAFDAAASETPEPLVEGWLDLAADLASDLAGHDPKVLAGR